MYLKQQKSDLESLGLLSPEARDSLRKLDASKDKGRVFGGVSHFVLRVRNLSDLISYLGNATLRTLREGDGDILPLFTNLGRGSLCNMVNTLCPLLQTKEKQMKKLINDLSSEIAYLLDNPTTSSIYMVEEEVIANIQDLVTKLENEINDSDRFLAKLEEGINEKV